MVTVGTVLCVSFLPSWIRIRIPNTDPHSEYGSGSTDLIESGSNTDLDPNPQPWYLPLTRQIWINREVFFHFTVISEVLPLLLRIPLRNSNNISFLSPRPCAEVMLIKVIF
jgi:hypothetical protein